MKIRVPEPQFRIPKSEAPRKPEFRIAISGMRMAARTVLAIVLVLGVVGCSAQKQSGLSQKAARLPSLTRDEVLQLFRERATPDEIREFEQLRVRTDVESRERALKLVLFRLPESELPKVGILPSRPMRWIVAGAPCGAMASEALSRALEPEHISTVVVGVHLGMCYRDVPREQFFLARRVLLAATNLSTLGVIVVQPKFSLE